MNLKLQGPLRHNLHVIYIFVSNIFDLVFPRKTNCLFLMIMEENFEACHWLDLKFLKWAYLKQHHIKSILGLLFEVILSSPFREILAQRNASVWF